MLFLLLSACAPLFPQTPQRNYVRSRAMLDSTGTRATETVVYHDGLGRPSLTLTNGQTADGTYTSTATVYDQMGRESTVLLPGGGSQSAGWMVFQDALSMSRSSHGGDVCPFTSNYYDGMGRLTRSYGPGLAWRQSQKTVLRSYGHNTAYSVRRYTPESPTGGVLTQGYYPAGSLEMERVTDEDGHWAETYRDIRGLVVLVRRNGGNDTYTVYDGHGDIRFVLTPMYQEDTDLGRYAYEYRYDSHRRCVWKRLPGCDPERYWYDTEDRVCYMDDASMRSAGRRRFFLYDRHNRLAVRGTVPATITAATLTTVTYTSAAGTSSVCGTGYVPLGALEDAQLEAAHYYDSYSFLSGPPTAACVWRQHMTMSAPTTATGLRTGGISRNTDGTLSYEVVYYDERGRQTDVRTTFPGGELLVTASRLSFTGKAVETTSILRHGDNADTLLVTMGYSASGDLPVSTDVSVDGCPGHRVATLSYDDVGRVSALSLPGGVGSLSYTYNVRGWVTDIQGAIFSEHVWYNDGPGTHAFNGQAGAVRSRIGTAALPNGYKYTYDSLGRLTDAVYGEAASLALGSGRYSEYAISYNANGAITAMKRNGRLDNGTWGIVDDLTAVLDGDRPLTVEDAATELSYANAFDFHGEGEGEYEYDGNGRLTRDPNKGVEVTYDLTGTPLTLSVGDVLNTYTYSAEGVKLRVSSHFHGQIAPLPLNTVTMGGSFPGGGGLDDPGAGFDASVLRDTRYCGPFILESDTLSMVLFPGGFCSMAGGQPSFHYYITDHRGDHRAVLSEAGTLEQANYYYPLGGILGDKSTSPGLQPYKHSGKEWDHMGGLDWYDYGARMYDPALGLWTTPDSLAEKNPAVSTYAFCSNDPVNAYDPDGRHDYILNKNGTLTFFRKTNAKKTHRVFSADKKNAVTVNMELINDLLDNFTQNGSYSYTKNGNDAFAFFKFAADNSNVEWLLIGLSKKGKKEYKVVNSKEGGAVYNDVADYQYELFHLHSHPRNSNTGETKASGDYNGYQKYQEGKMLDKLYATGDIWVLNNLYNSYQKKYPASPLTDYPKAYIYYAGDNLQQRQLYQYDLSNSRFNVVYNPSYSLIKRIVEK